MADTSPLPLHIRNYDIYEGFTARLAICTQRRSLPIEANSDPSSFYPHGTNGPGISTAVSDSIAWAQLRNVRDLAYRLFSYLSSVWPGSRTGNLVRENADPDNAVQEHASREALVTSGTPSNSECSSASTRSDHGFSLLDLPEEVIVNIMSCMPTPSLYCLRQASSLFMKLFDREEFTRYHPRNTSYERYICFSLRDVSAREKKQIATALHHEDLCDSCLSYEDTGYTSAIERDLRRPRHCDGCNEEHESVFFYLNDIKQHEENNSPLLCIGRLGEISLCGHAACKSTRWSDIERFDKKSAQWRRLHDTEIYYEVACLDRSHQPRNSRNVPSAVSFRDDVYSKDDVLPFPRLVVSSRPSLPSRFHRAFGWEQPLVRYNEISYIGLATLRENLSDAVKTGLKDQRLCPHYKAERNILPYVQHGTCQCLTRRFLRFNEGGGIYAESEYGHGHTGMINCHCGRIECIECPACGATYLWIAHGGQWSLAFRYSWEIQKPTSFGWLRLLDDAYWERMLAEEHRHVAWCDTPGCWRTKHPEYENLIKASLEDEYEQFPRDADARLTHDFGIMMEMALDGVFGAW